MNKGQLIADVASKTGQTTYRVEQALNTVLRGIEESLSQGREVDLGKELGRLKVVERKQRRVIRKNLIGQCKMSVVELVKQKKTVRLLGRGRDLSEDPQPTVVHPKEPPPKPDPIPARFRHIADAIRVARTEFGRKRFR
jgi:nucleoid DNA-binding protein